MEGNNSNNDIFNLSDLSDIPENIQSELKINSRDVFEKNIIEIFKRAKRDLDIDEITVAYYRVYKDVKERKQVLTKLYNMSKSDSPAIISVAGKKGVYRLINKEDPFFF